MDKWKYDPDRRLFLRNLSIVTAGLPLLSFGRKAYAMLANRMMMGAAGVGGVSSYISNGSLLDLACTAAELADGWTDGDNINGVSAAETDAPVADPMATVWSFDANTADAVNRARRTKDVGSVDGLGNRFVVSLGLYCDLIGTSADHDDFVLYVYRSDFLLLIRFASDGLYIGDTATTYEVGTNLVVQDSWQAWTFDVSVPGGVAADANCDVYLDNVLQASSVDCSWTASGTDGDVWITQSGYTTNDMLSYLDYLKIGDGFA